MRYRLLGRSGLRVSEAFLGTMTFGQDWGWGAAIDECRKIFDVYAEAGGNVIDTANRYTEGASEQIVGELVGADRDRFVISTKYTLSMDGTDPNAAGNHRKSLTRSLEQSLRRLRTDYIDLLWVHLWDRHTPVEETMRALDDAVRAGKVLYVGISDAPAWVVSRANTMADLRGWTPFSGLQVPYSLLNRDIERELLPMAEAYGMTVAAWSPLAQGVLSGKFARGTAGSGTRIPAESVSGHDLAVAQAVQDVADELGVTSAQVAIAWTRTRSRAVHPVIGARSVAQLTDNLAALECELPEESVRRLEEATGFVAGFPSDFIAQTSSWAFGEASHRVDGR